MRRDVIAICFAVMAGALAFAWLFVFLAALRIIPDPYGGALFYYAFFVGHLLASCATGVAVLFGIYMFVREPQSRRFQSYVIVGGALLLCIVLACVTAALPLP